MELKKKIALLESLIRNPAEGLPEEIFRFVTRITPIVNVDLLIKNDQHQTLLTWRDDEFYAPGWHIPGGIIRHKETIFDRINAVAASELGATVEFKKDPSAINEVIVPSRADRAHFISLLYECRLCSSLHKNLKYSGGIPKPGEWAWHDECPSSIISVHEMYRNFI